MPWRLVKVLVGDLAGPYRANQVWFMRYSASFCYQGPCYILRGFDLVVFLVPVIIYRFAAPQYVARRV